MSVFQVDPQTGELIRDPQGFVRFGGVETIAQDITIYLRLFRGEIRLQPPTEPGGAPSITRETPPIKNDEPLAVELRAFVGAVRGDAPFEVSGEDGRRALAVALAVAERVEESFREDAG